MIFEPFRPFIASEFQVKFAVDPWEQRGAMALRRMVFCEEQKIFTGSDRDAVDDHAIPLVAVSLLGVAADAVVGTVRIHEEAPGIWWGSRLAVASDHRRVGAIGASLIRLAVSSAHALGCREFFANVQAQNETLFHRMHWTTLEAMDLHGHPHLRMTADLNFYPPFAAPEIGFLTLMKQAA